MTANVDETSKTPMAGEPPNASWASLSAAAAAGFERTMSSLAASTINTGSVAAENSRSHGSAGSPVGIRRRDVVTTPSSLERAISKDASSSASGCSKPLKLNQLLKEIDVFDTAGRPILQ
jgi:hypothetical protein